MVILAGASSQAAQNVHQTTTIKAPVFALAIGPAKARVLINQVSARPGESVSRTVVVRKPVVAVALPFTKVTVRIGAN